MINIIKDKRILDVAETTHQALSKVLDLSNVSVFLVSHIEDDLKDFVDKININTFSKQIKKEAESNNHDSVIINFDTLEFATFEDIGKYNINDINRWLKSINVELKLSL